MRTICKNGYPAKSKVPVADKTAKDAFIIPQIPSQGLLTTQSVAKLEIIEKITKTPSKRGKNGLNI